MSMDAMHPTDVSATQFPTSVSPSTPTPQPSAAPSSTHSTTEGPRTGRMIRRRFTTPGVDPFTGITFEERDARIQNSDGSAVFEMRGAAIPADWSQLASDILVSKYFRKTGVPGTDCEKSARQVVTRIARTIRQAGESLHGYFADAEESETFEAELTYMLIRQIGAFNSPVWFNCGLAQSYGITGRPVGSWVWDPAAQATVPTRDAYTHPQLSACFIQSIQDDLMDIAGAVQREMRLFKFGSGTGTNFSTLRAEGERLSGGGTSSGLMSFLEILDRAAGATKSGGTTRRAAKMVILDADHPDIEKFINWKAREEEKASILIAAGYESDFNGEAYKTVSGQNSNNSVRLSDDFMQAVIDDREWTTHFRTTGEEARTFRARDLMQQIAYAAWRCADPGLQFDTTINRWHTCKESGRINASNPCSEYMFLDDSACNLASINLMKFAGEDGTFDVEGYRHAVSVFTLAMDIIVDQASYPTQAIAQHSHDYRPLGLGYANLGTLLMVNGIPYDSDTGRATAAALTAILTGRAYATSAEIAARKGPFAGYPKNRLPMLEVMNMHRDTAYAISAGDCPSYLLAAAQEDWDHALRLGERHGYRNAQATVIAPTGTIGLLMDCDTTGIEPDFALVKFKKLAGGGYFKIVNRSVNRALEMLGYTPEQIQDILTYVTGTMSLNGAPHVNRAALQQRGLAADDIDRIERSLPGVFELKHAFQASALSPVTLARLGIAEADARRPGFDLLTRLNFSAGEVAEAEEVICGRMTVEGAPHLKAEHLAVFDCANRCGRHGQRFIDPMGHVRMMAAVQPFVSGAISKTINMPEETTAEDVYRTYMESWRLGLKAVAIYRDGCKRSQPLSSSGEGKKSRLAAAESEGKTSTTAPLAAGAAPGAPTPGKGNGNGSNGDGTPATAAAPAPAAAAGPAPAPAQAPTASRRQRLGKKRRGFTQEARVCNNKVYVRTGEYPDGRLGEIFIDMHKEGAAFRSMMNCFAISVSLGLQHGVPLSEYVDAFVFTRFDPQGPVEGHPNIKFATSIVDYIFRVLGMEYLGRTDFLQVKPADMDVAEEKALEALANGAPAAAAGGGAGAGTVSPSGLGQQMRTLMGDAPLCDICGNITVRNGTCYKCMNCGNSMGCS